MSPEWDYDIRGDLTIPTGRSRETFYDELACTLYKNNYFLTEVVEGSPAKTWTQLEVHAFDVRQLD